MYQKTFAMIKPHALIQRSAIKDMILKKKISILKILETQLSLEQTQKLYAEHSARPFYDELCRDMSAGKVLLMILGGNNIIMRYRNLMGPTNPKDALPGTLRHLAGESLGNNAVHGSDSVAAFEHEHSIFAEAWTAHMMERKKKRQPVRLKAVS